jgi:hypothetical protein
LLLAILWLVFPLYEMLSPATRTTDEVFAGVLDGKKAYVRTTFSNLTFCGYTRELHGQTQGYYYYAQKDGQCILVLLSPATCEEGIPSISSVTVTGRILEGKSSYQVLLADIAEDLQWSKKGTAELLPASYFSEPDYHRGFTALLFFVYFATLAYALIHLLLCVLYILFPMLAPACQNLIVFGNPFHMLAEAEEELRTLPQLATEDMFITEHYFIMTSPNGNAIVPIREILWIYKHSTLHKFLWYHFSISYTLHITANRHLHISCPKNTKSDIDGIIDYLAEANHNILVGFNEENRLKIQAVQGKPLHIEKFYALMRRKV